MLTLEAEIDAEVSLRSHAWPTNPSSGVSMRSTYDALVSMLLPAFPSVAHDAAVELGCFAHLFARSLLLQDRLLDGDLPADAVGDATIQVMAMQHDAYAALRAAVPARSPFWGRLRGYLIGHAAAYAEEARFRRGRPLEDFTERLGISLAIEKHGVAKAVLAALVELEGADELFEPIGASLDAAAVAFQMLDDLEDWRLDLWTRTPSVLLARMPAAIWSIPRDESWRRNMAPVARHLYLGGPAAHVFHLALDHLEASAAASLPMMPWREVIARLHARCRRGLEVLRARPTNPTE